MQFIVASIKRSWSRRLHEKAKEREKWQRQRQEQGMDSLVNAMNWSETSGIRQQVN